MRSLSRSRGLSIAPIDSLSRRRCRRAVVALRFLVGRVARYLNHGQFSRLDSVPLKLPCEFAI